MWPARLAGQSGSPDAHASNPGQAGHSCGHGPGRGSGCIRRGPTAGCGRTAAVQAAAAHEPGRRRDGCSHPDRAGPALRRSCPGPHRPGRPGRGRPCGSRPGCPGCRRPGGSLRGPGCPGCPRPGGSRPGCRGCRHPAGSCRAPGHRDCNRPGGNPRGPVPRGPVRPGRQRPGGTRPGRGCPGCRDPGDSRRGPGCPGSANLRGSRRGRAGRCCKSRVGNHPGPGRNDPARRSRSCPATRRAGVRRLAGGLAPADASWCRDRCPGRGDVPGQPDRRSAVTRPGPCHAASLAHRPGRAEGSQHPGRHATRHRGHPGSGSSPRPRQNRCAAVLGHLAGQPAGRCRTGCRSRRRACHRAESGPGRHCGSRRSRRARAWTGRRRRPPDGACRGRNRPSLRTGSPMGHCRAGCPGTASPGHYRHRGSLHCLHCLHCLTVPPRPDRASRRRTRNCPTGSHRPAHCHCPHLGWHRTRHRGCGRLSRRRPRAARSDRRPPAVRCQHRPRGRRPAGPPHHDAASRPPRRRAERAVRADPRARPARACRHARRRRGHRVRARVLGLHRTGCCRVGGRWDAVRSPRAGPHSPPSGILSTEVMKHGVWSLDMPKHAEGHYLTVTALSGKMSGGVLLSHAASHAVPSALKGLTSGFGMGPGVSPSPWPPKLYGDVGNLELTDHSVAHGIPTVSREPHSGRFARLSVEAKPLGLLVPVSCTRCRASTSGLSTQSSSWGPYQVNPEGVLILKRASRLDAFSGYPFQT